MKKRKLLSLVTVGFVLLYLLSTFTFAFMSFEIIENEQRCMCEDDRLRNAEEGLVGERKQSGCSVQRRCGHRRDHLG